MCRPEVICAHPITPQTHIVAALGAKVKVGTLRPCEFRNGESEFAATRRPAHWSRCRSWTAQGPGRA